MSFKIYSNENIKNTLTSMLSSGRLSNSFLLYGENGLGKKTLAKYIAMQILCSDSSSSEPCMKCKNCRNILADIHPDVVFVEHSGARQGFSVETIRELSHNAYILPNDAEKKVFILSDCDAINTNAQNALLKLIEEPPYFSYFIFTATSKAVFLDTILSRIISLPIEHCSKEDCIAAMTDKGFNIDVINEAISAFEGNIGKCIEYAKGESLRQSVDICRDITNSIIKKSEYSFLTYLSSIESDRQLAKNVLSLLCSVIRDSSVIKYSDDNLISCYKDGAKSLSGILSNRQLDRIYSALNKAVKLIDGNTNMNLTLSAFCAEVKKII